MHDDLVSWDISIMDLPADAQSVAHIPDDFEPRPLGTRAALIDKIREVAPSADFSDPSWGDLRTADFTVEFNMGRDEAVDSIMLHVRGGEAAIPFLAGLLQHLGLRAIDCAGGDFFDPTSSAQSLRDWQDYRDRVVE